MFNRDSAFSMDVRDPENPDDQSRIVDALVVDGEMLIFKTTGIYRNLTADTLDPDRTDEGTRHSVEKLHSVGANSVFVARMILQFKKIVPLALSDGQRAERLGSHVWSANKLLLGCEEALYQIYQPAINLVPKCDDLIERHKQQAAIPHLPRIASLEGHVSQFFIGGKKFLEATYALLNVFFGLPLGGRNSAHFDKHREWIGNELGLKHPLYELLLHDESWVRLISECSNAIRHEELGLRIDLKNFHLQPGNKFAGPAWRYDLTKKGLGKQNGYTDLLHDLDVHLGNMQTFFEEILLLCLDDQLRDKKYLSICKLPESRTNPECPILYEVGFIPENLRQT